MVAKHPARPRRAAKPLLLKALAAMGLACLPLLPAGAQTLEDELRETWVATNSTADLVMPPALGVWTLDGNEMDVKLLEGEPVPDGQAIELKIKGRTRNLWDVRVSAFNTADIKQGDTVFVSLWAKTVKAPRGEDTGYLPKLLLQENGDDYSDFGSWTVPLSDDWDRYQFYGTAMQDFVPGEFGVVIHLGRYRQTIALGPVFVLNLGPDADTSALPGPDGIGD